MDRERNMSNGFSLNIDRGDKRPKEHKEEGNGDCGTSRGA